MDRAGHQLGNSMLRFLRKGVGLRVFRITAALASCSCSVNSDSSGDGGCTRAPSTSLRRAQRALHFSLRARAGNSLLGKIQSRQFRHVRRLEFQARAARQTCRGGLQAARVRLAFREQTSCPRREDAVGRCFFPPAPAPRALALPQAAARNTALHISAIPQRHKHPQSSRHHRQLHQPRAANAAGN